MLKHMILALVPALMFAATVKAEGDFLNELSTLDVSSINDAAVEIEDADFDVDMDQLVADAGENGEDAIESCFRRFGYRYRRGCGYGYGYGSYYRGYRYGCGYNSYYNYGCYRPLYCRPICYSYPVVSHYWGCY